MLAPVPFTIIPPRSRDRRTDLVGLLALADRDYQAMLNRIAKRDEAIKKLEEGK